MIDGYATDGLIAKYDLVVLEDDRRFFPPYEAAALLGAGLAARRGRRGRRADRAERAAQRDGDARRSTGGSRWTASRWRGWRPTRSPGSGCSRGRERDTARAHGRTAGRAWLATYLWDERRTLSALTARHLLLVAVSLAGAIALAVPLGLVLERARRGAEAVIRAVGVLQTIPGIALLAFMIPLLGIGVVPALVALFLYSLYPILRNTYTGVRDAAPEAVGAARALGMTPRQVLRYVRLPLAAPLIMAGIRTAAVINVGTATLAAFIGAGGLGDPIASGLAPERHPDDPVRRAAGGGAGAGGGCAARRVRAGGAAGGAVMTEGRGGKTVGRKDGRTSRLPSGSFRLSVLPSFRRAIAPAFPDALGCRRFNRPFAGTAACVSIPSAPFVPRPSSPSGSRRCRTTS